MRSRFLPALVVVFLIVWCRPGAPVRAQETEGTEASAAGSGPSWPREWAGEGGGKLVIYQPQLESWEGYRVAKAWYAISVTLPGEKEEVLGSLQLSGRTTTDHAKRTVFLERLKIEKLRVPEFNSSRERRLREFIESILPKKPVSVSLDNMLGNLERTAIQTRKVKINTAPPEIKISLKETLLLTFDGEAMFDSVQGTDLEVAINTPSALLKQGYDLYLLYERSWIKAPGLSGPWSPADKLPEAFSSLPETPQFAGMKRHVPGMPLKPDEVPRVYAATKPTELIVIYGSPVLKPVPKTRLSYIENTESDLFMLGTDYYLAVSGRWFTATGLGGPWTFCTDKLPADFSKIPADHETGRVLASVPKTDQALEAAIANQIPRMAQVNRKQATVEVTYEGEPAFEEIKGSTVRYATNTSFDVFLAGKRYYCCYEAVWFVADAPIGPWAVCDEVPKEIYEIPSDNPLYNCTYVAVYQSDPDNVWTGYTPGYYGSYYSGGVIVWGRGWRWRWRRAYWRHWWRHRPPRPTPYRRAMQRHHTYGHGRYYDHRTGRYRRSVAARSHHATPAVRPGAYRGWKQGAVRQPGVAKRQMVRKPQAVARKNNHYAGRDGSHYRKQGSQWQKRGKSGSWNRVQPKSSQLNRASRSRTRSRQRPASYNRYRASRGHRTSAGRRRSAAGARRGGGGRGGGGRGGGGRGGGGGGRR